MRVVEQKEELFKVPGSRTELKHRLKELAKRYKKGKIADNKFIRIVDYLVWATPYLEGEEYTDELLDKIMDVLTEHIDVEEKFIKVLELIDKL